MPREFILDQYDAGRSPQRPTTREKSIYLGSDGLIKVKNGATGLVETLSAAGVDPATTSEMQAGTVTGIRSMTPADIAAAITALAVVDVQTAAPTTGQTVTTTQNSKNVLLALTPAGTLSTLTTTLPSTPFSGQRWALSSSQIITTLTVDGGTQIGPTFTTLAAAGDSAEFVFDGTAWRRVL